MKSVVKISLFVRGFFIISSFLPSFAPVFARELKSTLSSQSENTCRSNDPDHICLALKYVVYQDDSNQTRFSKNDALRNIQGVNQVWSQCNIGFQVQEYVASTPKELNLSYDPTNSSELSVIRSDFANESQLLIVTTGAWDRSGSLGYTPANAWTSTPGEPPYGVVLERPVGGFSNLIGHELGHYLDLGHESNASNVMNPIVYSTSTELSSDQCVAAREAALSYWKKMIR